MAAANHKNRSFVRNLCIRLVITIMFTYNTDGQAILQFKSRFIRIHSAERTVELYFAYKAISIDHQVI